MATMLPNPLHNASSKADELACPGSTASGHGIELRVRTPTDNGASESTMRSPRIGTVHYMTAKREQLFKVSCDPVLYVDAAVATLVVVVVSRPDTPLPVTLQVFLQTVNHTERGGVYAALIYVTLAMTALEVSSRTMILIVSGSFAGIVGMHIYATCVPGWRGLWLSLYLVMLTLSGALLYVTAVAHTTTFTAAKRK